MVYAGLGPGPVELQVAHHDVGFAGRLHVHKGIGSEEARGVVDVGVSFARTDEKPDVYLLLPVWLPLTHDRASIAAKKSFRPLSVHACVTIANQGFLIKAQGDEGACGLSTLQP